MALKRAGVLLVAENYQNYISQLQNINRLHKEVFNVTNFKGYEEAAKKIGESLKNIPKNIPKTTFKEPTQEAMKLEEALKTLGQTGKFSLQKISEETLKVQQALATVRKSGQFQIGTTDIKSPNLSNLTKSLDDALKSANPLNKAFSFMVGNMGDLASMAVSFASKFTIVTTVIKVITDAIAFLNQSLAVAQRNETLSVALHEIGEQAGYSNKQIDLAVKLLNKQGITTQSAQQSLLKMTRANISWAEASKLATIAQGSAVIAGMNSSEAFERIVTGIQKMEPEYLDELGIQLRRDDAYKKMAQTLNKNSKELTEAERKQAILNEIYRQSESVIGVYGAAMETSGKKQASLARLVEETQNNLGKLLLPLQEVSVNMQTDFWKGTQQVTAGLSTWSGVIDKVIGQLNKLNYEAKLPDEVKSSYKEIEDIFRSAGAKAGEASSSAGRLIDKLKEGDDPVQMYKDLVTQFEDLGIKSDEAKEKAKGVISELLKAQDAAKGIENTHTQLKAILGPLGILIDMIPGIEISFEGLGRGAQSWMRIFVDSVAIGTAAVQTFAFETGLAFKGVAELAQATINRDWNGVLTNWNKLNADRSKEWSHNFQRAVKSTLENARKEFPELYESWEEVMGELEGSSEDLRLDAPIDPNAIDDGTEALEKQIEALEALSGAYKSVQNIQKSYLKEISNAEKDYQKGLANAEEKYQKEKAQMIEDQAKKLIEFDSENARKRAKMIDDFAFDQKQNAQKFALDQAQSRQSFDLKQKQDSRKFHDDMLREAKRFQLSMMQAQRTQQINDRRMRADGDVLALMEAREDFANQQQINQENFNLQKKESEKGYEEQGKLATENFKLQEEQAKQSFAMQTEMQREEFQRRLTDFDENIAIERQKMLEANAQALVDLEVKFEEEKVKLLEQYQERLTMAEEHRQEQLTALGDSLKEEGKITEEGMKEIAEKISEVFGSDAAGDALIKGWSERSQDEISVLVDNINAQINEMKENMENATAAVSEMSSNLADSGRPSSRPGFQNRPTPSSRPGFQNRIGARHGYQGTVTGPATFDVEPGVREHVSFTPASRFGNVRVGGRVGVDVSGMSQGVSPMVEESIANTFLEEIKVAVKRLSRRHS